MSSGQTSPLPPKKEVFLALLEGPSVFIHLDPRRSGVVVPAGFQRQPQLVLQVGRHMAVAIPDLAADDSGVTCTLSFNRTPFQCHLPWSAVYALVGADNRGMIWPPDVPAELAAQMAPAQPRPAPVPETPPAADKPKRVRKKKVAAEGAAEAKPKRAKKKDATPAAAPAPAPAVATAAVPAAAAPIPLQRPRVAAPGGATRKRRELPSYLRVIK